MKAELIDSMGSDLTVVNAARVSFDKHSKLEYHNFDERQHAEDYADYMDGQIDEEYVYSDKWMGGYPVEHISAGDAKLISYLGRHNHITTFTHCIITLRETVPIFVARQRFKHTVGFTYNEVSRRYVDSDPEFYTPAEWRSRPEGSVKQGSGDKVIKDIFYVNNVESWLTDIDDAYQNHLSASMDLYRSMLAGGVCPEQARMVLPQSMMTSYYVTGSLAAFARAYKLRSDSHAQVEIQVLAKQWDEIIGPLYPHSWKALTNA